MSAIAQRPKVEKWKYTVQDSFNIHEVVQYHLTVDCDTLKIYTIDPKATT